MSKYTTIPILPNTKKRLTEAKITKGEDWDSQINRMLDGLEVTA